MKTLYEYILTSVQNYKNNTALVQNSNRVTYTTLLHKIVTISDQLILEGLHKGDRVIVDVNNPINQFIASIAIIRAGGVTVPIENNINLEDKEFIFKNTKPFTLITEQRTFEKNYSNHYIFPHSIFHWNEEIFENVSNFDIPESILCAENENLQKISRLTQPEPSDLVFINYEKETKKLLAFNHKSIIYQAILLTQILDINPSHRELICFPMNNIHGFIRVLQNLSAGTTSFLWQNTEDILDIPAYILKNKCNSLFSDLDLINSLLSDLRSLTQEVLKNFILIHLSTHETSYITEFLRLHLSNFNTTKIFLSFSPLEAPITTLISVDNHDLYNNCVGLPLPGIKLKIYKSEDINDINNNKLCINGSNTMEGYYVEGRIDRSKFTDDNWLITDQYAYLDENGKLYLKGNIDEVVFINNDVISIQQIDRILSKILIGLDCEYYLTLKQDIFEKNKKIPILFYVPGPDKTIEPNKILEEITKLEIDFLKNLLILKVKSIPRLGNKVLREELLKLVDKRSDNI